MVLDDDGGLMIDVEVAVVPRTVAVPAVAVKGTVVVTGTVVVPGSVAVAGSVVVDGSSTCWGLISGLISWSRSRSWSWVG